MQVIRFGVENIVLILVLNIVNIVFGRDAPPVMIPNQGNVVGTYLTMYRTQKIIAYLGIPYAQPPLHEKRFTPPVIDNLPKWDGTRNASTFQADCWQNPKRAMRKHNELFQKLVKAFQPPDEVKRYDEDCLYVNIFVPDGE